MVAKDTNILRKEHFDSIVLPSNREVSSVVKRNAKILKAIRKKRGCTLQKLSKSIELSPSYISRLEAGTRRLNVEVMNKIAKSLGYSPDVFFKENIDDLESSDAYNGYEKNLPIYRVITEGVDVTDNPHCRIIFSSAMDYVYSFKSSQFILTKEAFAIYGFNDMNSPRYKAGDMLFFDQVTCKCGDVVMIVDSLDSIFIGELVYNEDGFKKIKNCNSEKILEFQSSSISKVFKLMTVQYL